MDAESAASVCRFELNRTDATEIAMVACRVVEAFDIFGHGWHAANVSFRRFVGVINTDDRLALRLTNARGK